MNGDLDNSIQQDIKIGPLNNEVLTADEDLELAPSSEKEFDVNRNNTVQQGMGSEETDANIFDLLKGRRSDPLAKAVLTTHVDSFDYNFAHKYRGTCLIINHQKFNPETLCSERKGTEKDFASLENCFAALDFDVNLLPDPTYQEIDSKIRAIASQDHRDSDCFVCCILTHGEEGALWAKDIKYPIENIFSKFKGDACPTLAGKPKLFFIQACRGDKFDGGVKLLRYKDVADSAASYRIPSWADFLIAYSCVPGYYSWRNTCNGSWFIQSLANVLKCFSHQLDLLTMLTLVNKEVAYSFESFVPSNRDMDKKKMVPCITSMLTRRVIFTPKIFLPPKQVNNEKQPVETKMETNENAKENVKENGKKS